MSKFKPNNGTVAAPGEDGFEYRPRRARTRPDALDTQVVSAPTELSEAPSQTEDAPVPARQFAFKCTLLFLYFRFSYVHEFISSTIHIDTHILIMLGLVCYAAWFVAGNIFGAYSERLAWVWTGFVGWLCVATVFSSWPGGSAALMLPYVRTVFPLLLLIPAVISGTEDFKKVMNTLGLAGTTTVLFGLLHRNFEAGRMDIATDGSSIQDPNDFAADIIMMLPAICYLLFSKQRSIFVKVFGVGIIGAGLLEIMSTGSRGGFVALLVMLCYVALTGSGKIRMGLFIGVPALGLLALPFVPSQSLKRIESIFNSEDASNEAAESAGARRALLMASLKATAQHPLFGVGPGTFMEYEAGMAAEAHQKGMWHQTHNGYTQISSECGVPALLLYFAAVGMTFKMLRRAARSELPYLPQVARTFAVMSVGYGVTLIFLAQGYKFTMLVIGAVAIAMNQVIAKSEKVRLIA